MASKVLYFDKLPANLTEQKLRRLLLPIAAVDKIVLLRRHNALYSGFNPTTLEIARNSSIQALVEAADVNAAKQIVQTLAETPLLIGGSEENETIAVSYSKNQELRDPNLARRSSRNHAQNAEAAKTNRILLVTVQNPTLPITTDFVHEIFSSYGAVEKIVVFVKPVGVQCLVQFASLDEAIHARNALNGLQIFPDCCTLVINFSNLPQELVVKENNSRTKDFLHPMPSETNEKSDNTTVEGDSDVLRAPAAPQIGERDAVSPVLLVCNLRESVTCDNLFNLFSCYGNVTRVKKLHGKLDHALIQFSSPEASQSAMLHLRGFTLLGQSLEVSFSRNAAIALRRGPAANSDALWTKEYGHNLNRFTGKYAHATKHIYSPTKILHLSNLEDTTTVEELKMHLGAFHGGENAKVKLMFSPSSHIQALAELPTLDAATNVLAQAHNSSLGTKLLKIAFSKHSLH